MSVSRSAAALFAVAIAATLSAWSDDLGLDWNPKPPGLSDSEGDKARRKSWREGTQRELDHTIQKVIDAEISLAAAKCGPNPDAVAAAEKRLQTARDRLATVIDERMMYEEDITELRRAAMQAGDEYRAITADKTTMPATRDRARRKYDATLNALLEAEHEHHQKIAAEAEAKIKAATKPACPKAFDEAPAPYTPPEGDNEGGNGDIMIAFGGAWGEADQREFRVATGAQSNAFSNDDNAFAGEVALGYGWAFGENGVAGIEAGVAIRDLDIRQTFAGGAYLAASSDWSASLLGRLGVETGGVTLSALAGVSLTDQAIELNFGAGASGGSEAVAGLTLGGEVAFPLALTPDDGAEGVVRVTYTGWDTAEISKPSGSPAFDYDAEVEEYRIFFGIRLDF